MAACLRAAEAATIALRLTDLQLAQWSAGGPPEVASPDGAPLPSPTSANGGFAASAAAAADGTPADAGSAETPSGAAPPPLLPAGLPKRKRATRGGAAAAAAAAGDASATAGGLSSMAGAGGGAAGAGRKEPLGKASALRHFSLKVCEKVESKVSGRLQLGWAVWVGG